MNKQSKVNKLSKMNKNVSENKKRIKQNKTEQNKTKQNKRNKKLAATRHQIQVQNSTYSNQ